MTSTHQWRPGAIDMHAPLASIHHWRPRTNGVHAPVASAHQRRPRTSGVHAGRPLTGGVQTEAVVLLIATHAIHHHLRHHDITWFIDNVAAAAACIRGNNNCQRWDLRYNSTSDVATPRLQGLDRVDRLQIQPCRRPQPRWARGSVDQVSAVGALHAQAAALA